MQETVDRQAGNKSNADDAGKLQSYRFADTFVAYGRAVNFLRGVDPYASYRFGNFAGTIAGQIERGHYLFAARGKHIVGYVGWAMCEEAVARAWVEGRHTPTFEECRGGECAVLMTWHAVSKDVVSFLARELRRTYPGRKAIFSRQYVGGKDRRVGEVFNRVNKGQRSVVA